VRWQVLIRWGVQRGLISIPKSSNPGRIAQNLQVLDWSLSEEAMGQLSALESNFRYFVSYLAGYTWHDGGQIEENTSHMVATSQGS